MHSLLSPHEFEARVRDIHNHLYANANVRTNEGIASEVAKVLLSLMYAANCQQPSLGVVEEQDRARAIAGDPAVCGRIAKELAVLFTTMNGELDRYPDSEEITLDPKSVAFVRCRLYTFDFSAGDRDWLGDALEVFRSLDAKRLGGQFFTDQRITDLSVTLLEFDAERGDDFVDICAGTGGFLLAAARRIAGGRHLAHIPAQPLKGLEVDGALHSVANGSLTTFMPKHEYVLQADSLAPPESWTPEVRRRLIPGTHSCLASNPPFGTKITIKDTAVLEQYELARRWSRNSDRWEVRYRGQTQRPPDVLFVERNLQLAEPGRGRVALVTPYQILSGPQLGYVREWVLRHARLRAVVDLPSETFQPWTGTKTSLLVYERRSTPLERWDSKNDPYEIFMAVAHNIGHDRRGHPTFNDNGTIQTDLPTIGQAFGAFRAGQEFRRFHDDAFIVSSSEILWRNDLRLNASFYRPQHQGLAGALIRLSEKKKWPLSTVGEVADRIFYPTRFKRTYTDSGPHSIPFLGGSQISQLVPTNNKFISKDAKNVDDLIVREGWILVTRSGTTGIVSSVPHSWDGVAMSEHVIRIVPNGTLAGEFIEAYLRSSIGQSFLAAGVFGSVIDEITPEYVGTIPIPLFGDSGKSRSISNSIGVANQARDRAIRGLQEAGAALDAELREALPL